MRKRTRKTISDPRIIAGLFREALFQRRILVYKSEQCGREYQIKELKEDGSRDKHGSRLLSLSLVRETGSESAEIDTDAHYYIVFPHFVAEWGRGVEFERIAHSEAEIALPSTVDIVDERSNRRTSISEATLHTTVVVRSMGCYFHADAKVIDVSRNGIGLRLSMPDGMPIAVGSEVTGVIERRHGTLQIGGSVVQVSLEGTNALGESTYRVGVDRPDNKRVRDESGVDERQFNRRQMSLRVSVSSVFRPNHPIYLTITDASVSGFAASLEDPADFSFMVLGSSVKFSDSTLVAELVSVDSDVFRFQIVSGSSSDRLGWLRELDRFEPVRVFHSAGAGSEIIDLFCDSGSFSSGYLQNQSKNAVELTQALGEEFSGEPWVHRWVEKTSQGGLKGYISAIRYADSAWRIGDIAGSIQDDAKISKDFIPAFLRGFRDYCLTLSPCPRVFLAWVAGHKFWAPFEAYLNGEGAQWLEAKLSVMYHRFPAPRSISEPSSSAISIQPIRSDDFAAIKGILSRISEEGTRTALALHDFSIERFGSPRLRDTFHRVDRVFARGYFLVKAGKSSYLMIGHRFPLGASPNQSDNVPWIVPISADGPLLKKGDVEIEEIRRLLIASGYSSPGVLELGSDEQLLASGAGTKLMHWWVGHPRMFSYFGGSR